MDIRQALKAELDAAQTELASAEIALLEAQGRAESAREGAARLEAAVAALDGASPPQSAAPSDNLSPEEFDAQRKKRQREREKEEQANNPLAHVPCAGCGSKGSLEEIIIPAPSGVPVRMLQCRKCKNQILS